MAMTGPQAGDFPSSSSAFSSIGSSFVEVPVLPIDSRHGGNSTLHARTHSFLTSHEVSHIPALRILSATTVKRGSRSREDSPSLLEHMSTAHRRAAARLLSHPRSHSPSPSPRPLSLSPLAVFSTYCLSLTFSHAVFAVLHVRAEHLQHLEPHRFAPAARLVYQRALSNSSEVSHGWMGPVQCCVSSPQQAYMHVRREFFGEHHRQYGLLAVLGVKVLDRLLHCRGDTPGLLHLNVILSSVKVLLISSRIARHQKAKKAWGSETPRYYTFTPCPFIAALNDLVITSKFATMPAPSCMFSPGGR